MPAPNRPVIKTNEKEMDSKNTVKINRKGHIYFCYNAAKALCIADWKWLKITLFANKILIRIHKEAVTSNDGSYVVRLRRAQKGSMPMRGSCLDFTNKLASRFGEFHILKLRYAIVSRNADEILISASNPLFQFAPGNDGSRSIPEQQEEAEAREEWFAEFEAKQEKSLGTISYPARPPALDNPTSALTRPLPENTPNWLRAPMSKGMHVRVTDKITRKHGWAIGVFVNTVSGNTLVTVYFDNELPCVIYHLAELSPVSFRLKQAAQCFVIAEKLSISLSPLQIKAINSGVIPTEDHGLPDEMFE